MGENFVLVWHVEYIQYEFFFSKTRKAALITVTVYRLLLIHLGFYEFIFRPNFDWNDSVKLPGQLECNVELQNKYGGSNYL